MPTGIICKKASMEPKQDEMNSIKIIPDPIRLEQHDAMIAKRWAMNVEDAAVDSPKGIAGGRVSNLIIWMTAAKETRMTFASKPGMCAPMIAYSSQMSEYRGESNHIRRLPVAIQNERYRRDNDILPNICSRAYGINEQYRMTGA